MLKIKPFLSFTTISMICLSCFQSCTTQNKEVKKEEIPDKKDTVTIITKMHTDEKLNAFYSILAGDSIAFDLNLSVDSKKKYYENSRSSNVMWAKMNSKLLNPVSDWKNKNIPSECLSSPFLFYPFSGPDFLIPNTIFSEAKHIVMFGLEAPGKDISKNGIDFALNSMPLMQKSLRDYFGKSYFITGNMIKDLNNDSLTGVTPLIATFITKSNFKLISIRNFKLEKSGEKNYDYLEKELSNKTGTYGVEINYTKNLIDTLKIDYLSFDAFDESLKTHPEITNFFETTVPSGTVTYLKSASYLLHYVGFSTIRNLVLKKSKYVLQDDTGLATKYFSNEWNLSLWGVYEKPIKDFTGVYQNDLDSLYKINRQVTPLPFNMGYHYFNGKQNLMLAVKK